MASSKAHCFTKLLYEQSIWFKALGYPGRILIIEHLLDHGTTSYKDLTRNIPLSKITFSQHLRALKKEQFIFIEERYPHSYYTLNFDKCIELIQKTESLYQKFAKAKASIPKS